MNCSTGGRTEPMPGCAVTAVGSHHGGQPAGLGASASRLGRNQALRGFPAHRQALFPPRAVSQEEVDQRLVGSASSASFLKYASVSSSRRIVI